MDKIINFQKLPHINWTNLPLKILVQLHWTTAWKVSKYGDFSGPNTGKYGPEKTPYLDTFHALNLQRIILKSCWHNRFYWSSSLSPPTPLFLLSWFVVNLMAPSCPALVDVTYGRCVIERVFPTVTDTNYNGFYMKISYG